MAPTTQQQQPQQHHAALSATALADRNRAVVARLLDLTFPTAAELRTIASYWSSISADERAALVATPFSPIRTALKDAIKQRCSCSNCKWSHISFLSRNADAALESRFHELREELCRCAGCASERLPSSASPSPSSSPYSSAPSSPRGSTATTSPASRATHVHGECVAHLSLFDAVLVLRDSRSLQTQYPPIVLPKATPPGGVVSILPHAARSASLVARLARLTSQLATAKEQLDECDACAAWLSLEFYWARHALQQILDAAITAAHQGHRGSAWAVASLSASPSADEQAVFSACRKVLYPPPPPALATADDAAKQTTQQRSSPPPLDDGATKSNARQRRRERRKLQAAQAALHAALVVESEHATSATATPENLVEIASRILSPDLVPVVIADAPSLLALDSQPPAPAPAATMPTATVASSVAPPVRSLSPIGPPPGLSSSPVAPWLTPATAPAPALTPAAPRAATVSASTARLASVFDRANFVPSASATLFASASAYAATTAPSVTATATAAVPAQPTLCALPCRVRSCDAYCTVPIGLPHDIHACDKVDSCFVPCSDPTCSKVCVGHAHNSVTLSPTLTHLCVVHMSPFSLPVLFQVVRQPTSSRDSASCGYLVTASASNRFESGTFWERA